MGPIIGVPLRYDTFENSSIDYFFDSLRLAIQQVGGVVMPIAPVSHTDSFKTPYSEMVLREEDKEVLDKFLGMCDGFILPGGVKWNVGDEYILDYAIRNDVPVLGICLSMQMMSCFKKNHRLERLPNDDHKQAYEEKYKHLVRINKESKLYKIIGKEELLVNSFHHYVANADSMYQNVAYSPDGVIEAIEYPQNTFNIGVQWHPERLMDDEDEVKLMTYFMECARRYQQNNVK